VDALRPWVNGGKGGQVIYEGATEVDAGEWTDEEMALLGAEAAEDLDDRDEIRP
jgi:hypothetical protein